jgi:hypothetical protein
MKRLVWGKETEARPLDSAPDEGASGQDARGGQKMIWKYGLEEN